MYYLEEEICGLMSKYVKASINLREKNILGYRRRIDRDLLIGDADRDQRGWHQGTTNCFGVLCKEGETNASVFI